MYFFQSLQSNRSVKDFVFLVYKRALKIKTAESPPNILLLCDAFLFIFERGKWILDNLVFGFVFGDILYVQNLKNKKKNLIVTAARAKT